MTSDDIDKAIASHDAVQLREALRRLMTWPYEAPIAGSTGPHRELQLRAVCQPLLLDDDLAPEEIHNALVPLYPNGFDELSYAQAADAVLASFDGLLGYIETEGRAAFPN